MADTLPGQDTSSTPAPTSHEDFLDRTVARFEQADAERDRAADRAPADDDDDHDRGRGDDDDEPAGSDDEDERDHSDASDEDTASTRDGGAGESEEDDEDDDEDTGAAESLDDDEDANDHPSEEEDEDENDDDEEAPPADVRPALIQTLERHGYKAALDKVPEEFRPIVEAKLQSIEAPFTRAMMELTAFRQEKRAAQAEQRYRAENPDLVVFEMLQAGGADLLAKVNARLDRVDPESNGNDATTIADNKAALDLVIEQRKDAARKAVLAEEQEAERLDRDAQQIEAHAQRLTKKLGVPFNKTVEKLLAAAIMEKPAAERGKPLTPAEIEAVVVEFAREHRASTRATVREASKQHVRGRTAVRTQRGAKPGTVRPPANARSAAPSRPSRPKVNHDSEESRQEAMMASARRIKPGARDE